VACDQDVGPVGDEDVRQPGDVLVGRRREVGTGPAPGARPARGADRPPAHRAGVGVDVPATVAARGRTAPRAGRRRRCLVVGRSAAAARGLAAGWTGPEHAVVTAGPAPPRLTGGAAPGVG